MRFWRTEQITHSFAKAWEAIIKDADQVSIIVISAKRRVWFGSLSLRSLLGGALAMVLLALLLLVITISFIWTLIMTTR